MFSATMTSASNPTAHRSRRVNGVRAKWNPFSPYTVKVPSQSVGFPCTDVEDMFCDSLISSSTAFQDISVVTYLTFGAWSI